MSNDDRKNRHLRYLSQLLDNKPEYFDFFGSLLTTAIVNCAKWLHPVSSQWEKEKISQILTSFSM